MGATGRILWGIVIGVCLLGLAVLEVVSERVAVDPIVTTASPGYRADSVERIAVLQVGWREGEER